MDLVDGLITFSLILIEALFVFDFFLVLVTVIIGLGTLVWVRFLRFPPFLAAYEGSSPSSATHEEEVHRTRGHDPEAGGRRRQRPPAARRR